MPTIKDVAQEANVAVGTVSRYFNGYSLKNKNRQSIEKAISKLNYKINPIAKSLKTSQTNNIVIFASNLTNNSVISVLLKIQNILTSKGYGCFICHNSFNKKEQKQYIDLFSSKMVDAFILFQIEYDQSDIIKYIKELNKPIVIIEGDKGSETIDCINVDHYKTIYQASNLLINLGHRKITLLTGNKSYLRSKEQLIGINDSFKDNNFDNKPYVFFGNMNSPVPYNNNQLKESVNHTTAFICGNSLSTQYFLKYCIENTIEIPKEVSFIGFDNNGFTQLYKENLTKIKKPATHLGELAAYTILKRMNGDYSGFPVTISLPASIETGNSINLL